MKKAGILIAILGVPALLALAVSVFGLFGKPNAALPVYGNKKVDTTIVNGQLQVDTVYYHVPLDSLVGQKLPSKIKIVHFLNSCNCDEGCGKKHSRLLAVDGQIVSENVIYVGFDLDSLKCIDGIKKDYQYKSKQYHFLLDSSNANTVLSSLLLEPLDMNEKDWWNKKYNEFIMLLDKQNRIRGLYRGSSKDDMGDLKTEIDVLLKL